MTGSFASVRKWLLTGLVLIFAGAAGSAQERKVERIQPACGPADTRFEIQTSRVHGETNSMVEPDKAKVYVIGWFFAKPPFAPAIVVRIGLDGSWVGAIRKNSYLAFSVTPGEHHLCMEGPKKKQGSVALTSFTADAGKRYYFRAHFAYHTAVDLKQIDPDEGNFLVSSAASSTSRPKK